jgi:tripartite-type tricarboxylate transporter receptor subunit TctC
MNSRRRFTRLGLATLAAAAGTLLALPQALAQAFPTQPVRIIVPLTPGSGADIVARALGQQLQTMWGQPVVIENRPGAGGQIGTREVVRATPDGHTLLIQSASHAANPAIYKQLPYDPLKELADVALLATTPYVMVSTRGGSYPSLQAIVDAAKAKPGDVPFASAGVGTSTHLTAELFAQAAGVKMLHIPFKGSPDAITDVAAGRSSFYMAPLPTVAGMLREGRVAPLAVTSATRVAALPDIPTVAESGYAGFQAELWVGLWAPAAVPEAVLAKISADVTRALQSEQLKATYAQGGNVVRLMSRPEFASFVRSEIETNKRLVRNAGIEPQ